MLEIGKSRKIATVEQVEVSRDLSGGVKIKLGGAGFVLSPDQAIQFGSAILQSAGCNVAFENPMAGVVGNLARKAS